MESKSRKLLIYPFLVRNFWWVFWKKYFFLPNNYIWGIWFLFLHEKTRAKRFIFSLECPKCSDNSNISLQQQGTRNSPSTVESPVIQNKRFVWLRVSTEYIMINWIYEVGTTETRMVMERQKVPSVSIFKYNQQHFRSMSVVIISLDYVSKIFYHVHQW